MLDIIIRKGMIIDGTGNPWYRADIGVESGRVRVVGQLADVKARHELDASGLVVSPGFIDTHSHSDLMLLVDPEARQKVLQGVTSELLGQDGVAVAPIKKEDISSWRHYVSGLLGDPDLDWNWSTLSEYLSRLETQGTSTNVVSLAPHGNIRMHVMGMSDRKPSETELEQMRNLLAQSMEQGAVGLSTGLIYAPCTYAQTEELVELCRVASSYEGIFVVHMRNEGDQLIESLNEVIRVGEQSSIPVHVSHHKAAGKPNWGKTKETLELMEKSREKGVDITCDQYPYCAGSTFLSSLLPPWAHSGGTQRMLERLRDSHDRDRIKKNIEEGIPGWENWTDYCGWEGIVISSVRTQKNKPLEGKGISHIAKTTGKDEFDILFDLLLEEEGGGSMVLFAMDEEDVRKVMRHPVQMVCTDGLLGGKPHPRVYGAFPRVLGRYVREEHVLTLEQAIRKMTSLPAQRLKLWDRGLLKVGMWADIVVFDPRTVIDKATFEDPHQHPNGINYVFVNGELVVEKGKHTGALKGKVQRSRC
nr:D-aminoacylase [Candidatus Njordarchaeum guaymaensis]